MYDKGSPSSIVITGVPKTGAIQWDGRCRKQEKLIEF